MSSWTSLPKQTGVWEVPPDPAQGGLRRFIRQRIVSFGMLLTIAFLLLVSLVISSALAALGDALGRMLPDALSGVGLHVLTFVVSFATIALLYRFVWIYYSANILFLGAEFTQAWVKQRGAGIRPAEGALRVIERAEVVGRGPVSGKSGHSPGRRSGGAD